MHYCCGMAHRSCCSTCCNRFLATQQGSHQVSVAAVGSLPLCGTDVLVLYLGHCLTGPYLQLEPRPAALSPGSCMLLPCLRDDI
jgi:hypothetical protein